MNGEHVVYNIGYNIYKKFLYSFKIVTCETSILIKCFLKINH